MSTATKEKTVTFLCFRFPELVLVFKPHITGSDKFGHRVVVQKATRLFFQKNPAGVGTLELTDADQIEFVRSQDMFKSGHITEATSEDIEMMSGVKPKQDNLVRGVKGSNDEPEVEPEAPAEPVRKTKAVKTPGKKK